MQPPIAESHGMILDLNPIKAYKKIIDHEMLLGMSRRIRREVKSNEISLSDVLLLVLGTLIPLAAQATTVTASCKDGTTFSGASRKGACAGHGGVQTWGTAAPAATSGAAATNNSKTGTLQTAAAQQAPRSTKAVGGGAGQVWVSTSSKAYHCAGTRWYGKTKNGKYMTEAAAKADGFHPSGGKACTS
jgi:hypothetical protein